MQTRTSRIAERLEGHKMVVTLVTVTLVRLVTVRSVTRLDTTNCVPMSNFGIN